MKIDCSCHCGHITYESVVDPEQVEVCHCKDCQTFSGSALRTVVAAFEGNIQTAFRDSEDLHQDFRERF